MRNSHDTTVDSTARPQLRGAALDRANATTLDRAKRATSDDAVCSNESRRTNRSGAVERTNRDLRAIMRVSRDRRPRLDDSPYARCACVRRNCGANDVGTGYHEQVSAHFDEDDPDAEERRSTARR
jgi:hypothetical protein